MNNQDNKNRAKKFNVGYLFSIVMIITYIGMACLLSFTDIFEAAFSPAMRYTFSAVFAIYGIFRSYRFIKNRGGR